MQNLQAKIPYRIPLVGGFTDFPEFYRRHGGRTISCPIDKYITVSIKKNRQEGLDIQSKADLPWGMGLGSSGAYYVGLVSALARFKNQQLSKLAIAKLAFEIETGLEKHSTGRQDSLACLFNGISVIRYFRDDSVEVNQLAIPDKWRRLLARRLLLFDIGQRRNAVDPIRDILLQNNTLALKQSAALTGKLIHAWKHRDLDFLATAMNAQEQCRKLISKTCESEETSRLLVIARSCGAGARLTGAGLGCLLCYCHEDQQTKLRKDLGMPEIKFSILW